MAFYCRDCKINFKATLPDGSCPDCYTSSAVEKVLAEPVPEPNTASPVLRGSSEIIRAAGTPNANGQQRTESDNRKVQAPMRQPVTVTDQEADHLAIRPGYVVSDVPPQYRLTPMQVSRPRPSVPLAPPVGFLLGTPQPPPMDKRPAFVRPSQQLRPSASFPQSFIGGTEPLVCRQNGMAESHFIQNGTLGIGLTSASVRALTRSPSDQARFESAHVQALSLGDCPTVNLFYAVDLLKLALFNCVDTCSDKQAIVAQASLLQYTLEILEEMKTKLEQRANELLGCGMTIRDLSCGIKNESRASATSVPDNVKEDKPRRPRKNKAPITTVVVKDLPADTLEPDLYKFFERFCGHSGDVVRINIAKTPQRKCRGFAYVVFANEAIVKKVVHETTNHKIRNTLVKIEEYDEEDQIRRKQVYQIFVAGLSSFITEENFEDYLSDNYGEVEKIYYSANPDNPGHDRAHAFVSFKDLTVTKKTLDDKFLFFHNRKLTVRPFTTPAQYIDLKKKEGRFVAPNDWRTPVSAAGSKEDQTVHRKQKEKHGSESEDSGRCCCICMDEDSCVLFKPCGHVCVCVNCSEDLHECPYCRGDIEQKDRIIMVGTK